MKTQMTTALRSSARKAVMALGVLAVMGAAAAPAFADGRDDHRYEHSRHSERQTWRGDERGREWRWGRFERHYVYGRPSYYGYAAPRYYAPPPVYYPAPGLSFDFTVPLR